MKTSKTYTHLTIAAYERDCERIYVPLHEFGHGAFGTFMKKEIKKMRVHNLYGGGMCVSTEQITSIHQRKNKNIVSYNLQMMMLRLAGNASTLFFKKMTQPDGSSVDVNNYVRIYYDELILRGGIEKMYEHLTQESSKIKVEFTDEQNILAEEYVDMMINSYGLIKRYIKDIDTFEEFTIELVKFMFKLLTFVKDDVYGFSLGHANRRFLTAKACEKVTLVFNKTWNKVRIANKLEFV